MSHLQKNSLPTCFLVSWKIHPGVRTIQSCSGGVGLLPWAEEAGDQTGGDGCGQARSVSLRMVRRLSALTWLVSAIDLFQIWVLSLFTPVYILRSQRMEVINTERKKKNYNKFCKLCWIETELSVWTLCVCVCLFLLCPLKEPRGSGTSITMCSLGA